MSTIAFTICSINYLAQAITLGKSLEESNLNVDFRIYLVDKFEGREHIKDKIPFQVIEIENIPVTDFKGMCVRYNITELNTAVKPYIINHILKTEININAVFYFDPDIMVFGKLNDAIVTLSKNTLIVTPHLLTPSDEHPFGIAESSFLNGGTFNLGFIGVSRCDEAFKFLDWWQKRLINQAYSNSDMHLFFDQKWINLAIVFFQNVYIEKSPGYNMAGWNLHEREVTSRGNNLYKINHDYDLIFYHFSGVKAHSNDVSRYSLYSLSQRPDLKEIIDTYRLNLIKHGVDFFSTYKCYYSKFYKGITIYYPKYHWITIYRRTRVYLGKIKRIVFLNSKPIS
ncbi:glycosyl transferase [Pontibacter pudoricolor]|uniref:glycosyl transferase n=1 Tax=Pontibacter pudoricolor TaxID=2694930 RepID=UPI001391538A|nr:glycosyl transferase [Pontibacter pudoricolor]